MNAYVMSCVVALAIVATLTSRAAAGGEDSSYAEKLERERKMIFESNDLGLMCKVRLSRAWKRVTGDKKCDSDSLRTILIIRNCASYAYSSEPLFREATQQYAKQCLTGEHLSAKVKSAASKALNKFVDHEFVNDYYKSFPDHRQPHCATQGGNQYADNHETAQIAGKVIEREFASQGKDARAYFSQQPDKIEDYVKSKIFNPCASVKSAFKKLGTDLFLASRYFPEGESAMLGQLDEEARDHFFRYKMCDNLDVRSFQEDFLKVLSVRFV